MFDGNRINPDMPVVCSKNGQFATVDHTEGADFIKLKKDKAGQHHFIPMAWVKSVDDKVHIDRTGDQAMKEWTTSPRQARSDAAMNERATNDGMKGAPEEDKMKDMGRRSRQDQTRGGHSAP